MAFITLLPTESVVHVLQQLPPVDIRTCKLVSRQFLATVQESPELQYLLELDSLGFVPPLNPHDTLSLGDKIRLLQEKRSMTDGSCGTISARTTKLDLIGSLGTNIQYSRGVLAVGRPSIDVTRQLQLYQLASRNKRTESSSLLLHHLGAEAHDFRLDPDLDLLVLLESITTLADINSELEMRFHLRSLSTGLVHPLAPNPVLRKTFKFMIVYSPTGFQIVGNLLIILSTTNSLLDSSPPRLCIWNWTTGELITSTEVPGEDFVFISEDTFLIPVGRHQWVGHHTIGSLLVFTIAGIQPGGRARHIATLHLPRTAQGPCHSRCQPVPTSLPPAPLSINGHLTVTTPKRIYEVGPNSHYLCLHVKAFNIESVSGEMANGILFAPFSSIHRALNKITTSQPHSPVHIPWEDWARGASWINTRRLRHSSNCIFGHRAALLSFDRKERGWRAFLYDLRASTRGSTTDEFMGDSPEKMRSDAYLDAIFINSELDVREPGVITSFLVSENEEWNEHTDSIPPELAIDDERLITYDETRLRASPELHVYDI